MSPSATPPRFEKQPLKGALAWLESQRRVG